MTQPNTVDEGTIQATLAAFQTAMAQTNAAIASVEAVSTSVPWRGEASTRYRDALASWMSGVRDVQAGLTALETAMNSHLRISSGAESESTALSNWYQG
jgi:uncharacterized protein YukE